MAFYSPLRYPGGKGKISDFIQLVYKKNSICDGYYVEPYAGGAAVALSLLFNEYATKIIINDIDRSIYAFWYSVLNRTDKLCDLIKNTNLTVATWEKQREVQTRKQRASLLDLGFSTFFLNRTNTSGIIKAGIIGGKNQQGKWKIDARFNKDNLIERIQRIAEYKDRIHIYNLDACKLIKQVYKEVPEKTFFYFDPPYYVRGKELYVNYFTHKDHVEVASLINKKLKNKLWIVSYDYNQEIINLYKDHRQLKYQVNYSVRKATKGFELMFFSDKLAVPKTRNPSKVKY